MSKEERKGRLKYGDVMYLHKTMDLKLSCNEGRYEVHLSNVTSDFLILLADTRNKMRLMNNWYFTESIYKTIEIDFFVGGWDDYGTTTTIEFFIKTASRSKVSLILMDKEPDEKFICGGELTKYQLKNLQKEDREAVESMLEQLSEERKEGELAIKTRWDKTKYKKEED